MDSSGRDVWFVRFGVSLPSEAGKRHRGGVEEPIESDGTRRHVGAAGTDLPILVSGGMNMLLKSMRLVRSGETLALPLRRSGRRELLLAAGTTLDATTLEKLARIGVRQAWVECPGTEGLEEYLPLALESARDDLAEPAGAALNSLASTRNPAVDLQEVRNAVATMVAHAQRNARIARLVTEVVSGDDELARHSVAVAHLSLLLGLLVREELEISRPLLPLRRATKLGPIAMCGLLHDAGRLIEPCEEDLETPKVELETPHCTSIRGLLSRHVEAPVVAGAAQHHQRFDGSGYPRLAEGTFRSRKGRDIHVFARIVMVADHFDRRRAAHPEETRLDTLLWMAHPDRRGWFDPGILTALPIAAPPFPPGSIVTLSHGPKAVVLRASRTDPLRPTVRILRRRGEGERIDLESSPDLHVTRHDGRPVPPPDTLKKLLQEPGNRAA